MRIFRAPEFLGTAFLLAVLAMLVDTMIPEAYAVAHDAAGLITVAGFLVGFTLSKGVGA